MLGLARAAERQGLQAKGMLLDWPALRRAKKPSILWLSAGEAHFVVVEAIHADTAVLVDPDLGRQELKRPQLEMIWQGQTLVLSPMECGGSPPLSQSAQPTPRRSAPETKREQPPAVRSAHLAP